MSKPSTYLYALIAGVSLGWLAQQFWNIGSVHSSRSRDSLMSQNVARLQELKVNREYKATPEMQESEIDESDLLLDLILNNKIDAAEQLFRDSWGDFSQDLSLSRAIAEKRLDSGNYHAAFALLYDQRLFVPFEQEDELLQLIYTSVENTETKLAEKNHLKALVDLYNLLISLHAEHAPYYLRLTYWLLESGDYYGAEQSLAGAMNDIKYEDDVELLAARIEKGDTSSGVVAVPINKIGEHFVVKVLIDNNYTVELMIDTGATMSVLKTSLVESNDAEALFNSDSLTMNTANGKVSGKRVMVESFVLGQYELKGVEVGVVPLPDFRFDGLLGMNVLSRYDFFIDQERQLLVLK